MKISLTVTDEPGDTVARAVTVSLTPLDDEPFDGDEPRTRTVNLGPDADGFYTLPEKEN